MWQAAAGFERCSTADVRSLAACHLPAAAPWSTASQTTTTPARWALLAWTVLGTAGLQTACLLRTPSCCCAHHCFPALLHCCLKIMAD